MPGRDRPELRIAMWGWSDDSEMAAAMHARSRVDAVAARGGPRTGGERWDEYYPASPVREPVLVAYDGDGVEVSTELEPDSVRAFVTRTRYGAIVLNTDAVVIVDVDLPPPAPRGVVATIARWLSPAPTAPAEPAVDEASVLARARALAAHRPGVGVRTYRTRAGFRLLVTGTGLAPTDPGTAALLAELGSDPLYARLCSVQRSFRARLTPKPWRIAVPAATAGWPQRDAETARGHAAWIARYEQASAGWAVCALVDATGPQPAGVEAGVVALHDAWTLPESGLPLA